MLESSAARGIPESDWVNVTVPAGFRFAMPGQPTPDRAIVRSVGSGAAQQYTVIRKTPLLRRGVAAFVVVYADRDARSAPWSFEEVYEAERDRILDRTNGLLLQETERPLNGHPGREFQAQVATGVEIITRIYLIQDRLYILLTGGPLIYPSQPDAERFFASFRVQ